MLPLTAGIHVARLARGASRDAALASALEILEDDHSLVSFYIPPEARWAVVSGRESFAWPKDKGPKSLGEQLTATLRAIVKHNRDLAGVIDIVDYSETRNGEREISDAALKRIIEKFSDLHGPTENHKILARLPIGVFWTTNYDTLIEET